MKSNKLKSAILFLVGILPFFVQSQIEFADEKIKWKFRVEQKGCEGTIIADVQCAPHWHFCPITLPAGSFGFPTKISVLKNKDIQLVGKFTEPKPVTKHDDEADEDIAYHEGKVQFKQKFKTLSSKPVKINISYEFQACDESHCLPPFSAKAICTAEGCEVVETNNPTDTSSVQVASSTSVKKGDDENKSDNTSKTEIKKQEKKKTSLWIIFIGAFLSGFVALIMPCVFPMIPMTVSFFTKRSKSKAQGIKNSFLYGGSIVLIHFLLGLLVVITKSGSLLNEMSTNVYFNIFFFLMLFVFGLSFLGAFEIQLPAKWVNKADAKADKGGVIGIFFMALVLSLASFSCTGPLLGGLLAAISSVGGDIELLVGITAFGFALALPFMLFALFPSWLNSMPNSGGWLNVVKVFLGFLEIAFAFKFLSTADTTMQWHLLEREVFIAIWIAVFGTLGLYLLGKIRLPHDSPVEKLSVGRTMMATLTIAFTMYLIPGLWGAPLKIVNAFLPPDFYAESPKGFGGGGSKTSENTIHVDGMHEGPQGLMAFNDYDKALAYSKKVGKPLFVDFTGWGCVNCRKMEQSVWGEPGVIEHLRNDFVIVSLYVDERTELPKKEQKTIKVNGRDFSIVTIGNKWTAKQMQEYKTASQPYYVIQTPEGVDVPVGSADYTNHSNPKVFQSWLEKGLKAYKK